jgi:hypothetical protein
MYEKKVLKTVKKARLILTNKKKKNSKIGPQLIEI